MISSKINLQHELERKGYLSLVKFTKYLKMYEPQAYISYPTALKLVNEGKLKAIRVGASYRVLRTEVVRWVAEGNWERRFDGSYPRF